MKRFVFLFSLSFLLLLRTASSSDDFIYFEGSAATVNKEVIFFSEIVFEQCLLRCGALPETHQKEFSLSETRERLIEEMLAIQEHEKLGLGQIDNVVFAEQLAEVEAKLASCGSTCRQDISEERLAKWLERKLVIRNFLYNRVELFVDVSEEDVRKELDRRAHGGFAADLSADEVRQEIREEKIARETQNWRTRAASRATITLSPLEGKWPEPMP